jgi:hypothetical protein
LPLVVACAGAVLVSSPPGRPAEPVPGIVRGFDDQACGEAGDFVAGQRDLLVWGRGARPFIGCGDSEERGGEHGKGDPAMPGGPASDLVLIEPGEAFADLEILLDGPPGSRGLDQRGQGGGLGRVAAVEGQFPAARVAADQQPPASRAAAGDGDPGPVVVALAFGAVPGGQPLPGASREAGGERG